MWQWYTAQKTGWIIPRTIKGSSTRRAQAVTAAHTCSQSPRTASLLPRKSRTQGERRGERGNGESRQGEETRGEQMRKCEKIRDGSIESDLLLKWRYNGNCWKLISFEQLLLWMVETEGAFVSLQLVTYCRLGIWICLYPALLGRWCLSSASGAGQWRSVSEQITQSLFLIRFTEFCVPCYVWLGKQFTITEICACWVAVSCGLKLTANNSRALSSRDCATEQSCLRLSSQPLLAPLVSLLQFCPLFLLFLPDVSVLPARLTQKRSSWRSWLSARR